MEHSTNSTKGEVCHYGKKIYHVNSLIARKVVVSEIVPDYSDKVSGEERQNSFSTMTQNEIHRSRSL